MRCGLSTAWCGASNPSAVTRTGGSCCAASRSCCVPCARNWHGYPTISGGWRVGSRSCRHCTSLLCAAPRVPAQSGSAVRLPDAAVDAPPPRAAGTSDGQDFSGVDAGGLRGGRSGARGLDRGAACNGDLVRVKLAWRSPQSGINLFVDRRGRKALELDGKGIMTLQQQGTLIVLGEAPIVDRAMEAVVQTLKGGGSHELRRAPPRSCGSCPRAT